MLDIHTVVIKFLLFLQDYNAPADTRPPANLAKPGGVGVKALQSQIGAGIKVGPPPTGPKKCE